MLSQNKHFISRLIITRFLDFYKVLLSFEFAHQLLQNKQFTLCLSVKTNIFRNSVENLHIRIVEQLCAIPSKTNIVRHTNSREVEKYIVIIGYTYIGSHTVHTGNVCEN